MRLEKGLRGLCSGSDTPCNIAAFVRKRMLWNFATGDLGYGRGLLCGCE